MRLGVIALVLVGCSSPALDMPPRRDAAAAPEDDDAGGELDAGADAIACTPSSASLAYGKACDGGWLYGNYGGTCPRGDVGACAVLSADAIGNYAESCCARLACVRVDSPTGDQCRAQHDSGAWEGWMCPSSVAPPKGCEPLTAGSKDMCCPR